MDCLEVQRQDTYKYKFKKHLDLMQNNYEQI